MLVLIFVARDPTGKHLDKPAAKASSTLSKLTFSLWSVELKSGSAMGRSLPLWRGYPLQATRDVGIQAALSGRPRHPVV